MAFITLLFLLLVGHALADFPLQGEFLSQAKNPNTPVGKEFWKFALTHHAIIHGGFVFVITHSNLYLGLAEIVIHWVTDLLKCYNKISLNVDQAVHIACKIVWALIATNVLF